MPTIFIVDPDPNTPDPLADRLRHKGYHVLCLRDPEEAADCMRSVRADLLVVDLRGTTMSRPAVMASLRARRAYQAMPVIVVGRGFAEARCIHASGGSAGTDRTPRPTTSLSACGRS